MINIYTDGACSGNPGKGGWGVVILDNNKEILLNGGDQHTTNNKMELTAAIKALEYFEIKKELIIYTDGACSGNPGIGGWGVVILVNKQEILLNGGDQLTTNNKMELTAAIKALEYFETKKDLTIYTDSKYVKDGIESWIINWKKNGWKTSTKKIVKNKELWMQLDNLINKHSVTWKWVKGHAGFEFNEKADELARKYIESNI